MNIVITGASKGLGYAVAEAFATDGAAHTFYLCARNEKKLKEAAAFLQRQNGQTTVLTYAGDISQKAGVLHFAEWINKQTTTVDILINNAGLFLQGSLEEEPDDALEALLQTNLYAAYHLTRAILPAMKKKNTAHIFNICSVASLQPLSSCFSYSISKFALMGFSKNLRETLKPYGIKVTTVYPGAFVNDSRAEEEIQTKKMMEAADIAKMIHAAAHLSVQACAEEIILRPQTDD